MLTSTNNQYLRPEYLSPLQGSSIELDAKKSPLALLAQTCSSIGADMGSKSSVGSTDKNKQGKSSPGAKSPGAAAANTTEADAKNTSSSFKPYEKKIKEEDDERLSPKRSTPGARSPSGSVGNPSGERASSRSSDSGRCSSRTHEPPTSSPGGSTRAASPVTPKTSPSSLHSSCLPSALGDLSKDPLAAYRLAPSLYPHLALGLDPMLGAAGLSALTAKVPSSSSTSPSLSSPYVGYARVKTVSGSETVIPVCRDPYCTGCSINAHAAQVVNGTCPPACTQCAQVQAHTKTLAALPGLIPSLPASQLRSGLYPPPGLVGGSHQPYVCNWIAADNYCGKRFASSEELLQHLRSHTNLSTSDSSLPLHAAAAAAAHLQHPLLAGHLPRGYPTPPLSPLSAARYHPYHKSAVLAAAAHLPPTSPLPPAFSAAALSGLAPHPLSAYYSPYSLYARAASGLHP